MSLERGTMRLTRILGRLWRVMAMRSREHPLEPIGFVPLERRGLGFSRLGDGRFGFGRLAVSLSEGRGHTDRHCKGHGELQDCLHGILLNG